MDEIVLIFRKCLDFVRDAWRNFDKDLEPEKNERANDNDKETKEPISCEPWTETFLADEPNLRDLLQGVPTEHDLFEIVCTMNKFVFYYVIVRAIGFTMFI